MAAITVIPQRSFPYCTETGRHLFPGEIAIIDCTSQVERDIERGLLYEVPGSRQKDPEPEARRGRSTSSSAEEESPE